MVLDGRGFVFTLLISLYNIFSISHNAYNYFSNFHFTYVQDADLRPVVPLLHPAAEGMEDSEAFQDLLKQYVLTLGDTIGTLF